MNDKEYIKYVSELSDIHNAYIEALSSLKMVGLTLYEDGEPCALGYTKAGKFVMFPYEVWEFYVALRDEVLEHSYMLGVDYETEDDQPSEELLLGDDVDYKIINLI